MHFCMCFDRMTMIAGVISGMRTLWRIARLPVANERPADVLVMEAARLSLGSPAAPTNAHGNLGGGVEVDTSN